MSILVTLVTTRDSLTVKEFPLTSCLGYRTVSKIKSPQWDRGQIKTVKSQKNKQMAFNSKLMSQQQGITDCQCQKLGPSKQGLSLPHILNPTHSQRPITIMSCLRSEGVLKLVHQDIRTAVKLVVTRFLEAATGMCVHPFRCPHFMHKNRSLFLQQSL